jgi:phosphoglycerol transferase MdoB-like AlkP superfamily enzyme
MGARGTLGTIPLRQRDRSVSKVPVLNNAVPNAILAMNWAWNNYLENPSYPPVDAKEGPELAIKSIGRKDLTSQTPESAFLEKNPPHVVVAIVEGFGANLLELDKPGSVDLMGALRPHAMEDFFFRRFLAEGSRTMAAVTRTIFYCPDMDVTKGPFKKVKLDNSPFDIYKQHGYETVFIHPGLSSWWDMEAYLSVQGVDRTFFSQEFLERYQDAKLNLAAGSWGLPDEYAYRMALELLEQSTKPMFIVIVTLSNHTPFNVPSQYKDRYPINPDAEARDRFFERKGAVRKILTGYQYASNCLGDFVAAIKRSPLAGRTLIGATGDHASAQIKAKYPEGLFLNKASPFYLYVPKPILERTKHLYAPERLGSHKDILPTLYSFSLPGATYYTVGGRNMLAAQDDPALAFGYNVRLYMDGKGACGIGAEYSGAWHSWSEGGALNPNPEAITAPTAEKISNYEKLYRWQINARIGGFKKGGE